MNGLTFYPYEIHLSATAVSLIVALFGGVGLKLAEHWLGARQQRISEATGLREELRKEITDQREEIAKLEADVTKYRDQFYDLRDKFSELFAKYQALVVRYGIEEKK